MQDQKKIERKIQLEGYVIQLDGLQPHFFIVWSKVHKTKKL